MSSAPERLDLNESQSPVPAEADADSSADALWHGLIRRLAGQADPGWLADWPESLVHRAQRSALGCRLISVRLGASVAPHLFSTLSLPPASALKRHPWLYLSQSELLEAVMDVGAMAMSPAIHTVVRRDQMRRIRRVLGERRYRRALQVAVGSAPPSVAAKAQANLDSYINSDTAITEHTQASGLIEIGTVIADEHPALQQRLRIAFPPSQALQTQKGWLPESAVLRVMAQRCSDPGNADHKPGADVAGSAANVG